MARIHIESLHKGDVAADLIGNENQVQNDNRGDSILKEGFEKALRDNTAVNAKKNTFFQEFFLMEGKGIQL